MKKLLLISSIAILLVSCETAKQKQDALNYKAADCYNKATDAEIWRFKWATLSIGTKCCFAEVAKWTMTRDSLANLGKMYADSAKMITP